MSQWKYIVPVIALSLGAALTSTGCAAQGADCDEDDAQVAPVASATEPGATTVGSDSTGEARQAWACNGGPFPWFPWWNCCGCGGGCGGGFGGFGGGCGGFGGGCGGFGGCF